MKDLILQALRESIKKYPELKEYLTDLAKQIAEDGIEWHQKFPGVFNNYEIIDWDTVDSETTQDDIDEAIKRWDKMMPDYKGLLNAKFESGE